MTTDNHTEIQLEFVRKALRFFYEDLPEGEYDGSEDDLQEYASTIIEGFGYDLDTQLAALTAERDAKQNVLKLAMSRVVILEAQRDTLLAFVNGKLTRAEMEESLSKFEGVTLK